MKWLEVLKLNPFFLSVQNRRLPVMSWPKWSSATVRTPLVGRHCSSCRRRRRWLIKTTWSSSTTACPRRRAHPSQTSLMTYAARTTSTCCTSTPPRTTQSCPCRTRSDYIRVGSLFAVIAQVISTELRNAVSIQGECLAVIYIQMYSIYTHSVYVVWMHIWTVAVKGRYKIIQNE